MLRIIGGAWRGRRFHAPDSPDVRPTADRVREAVFNILGQRLEGQRVLDLYAGAGALGLEALSRGAEHATFVERTPAVAAVIRQNLERLEGAARATVVVSTAEAYVARRGIGPYDTIFADPPYRHAPGDELWSAAVERLLVAGGRLVIEHAARSSPQLGGLDVELDERRYGDTAVTLVAKPPRSPADLPDPRR